ncbi:ATP-binding protein [Methylophaga nitratireducenticrescens]|uniref:ATPase component of ABC transporters with duplicated ATPase domains n=1 Tax=Methylophaga nitratireducenticrescens TaxID=754476 RepID=I1XGR2_METNJ|nr:AAA family ATPase [Methylophaga nitratireducenticrescens]AFI83581.1 ATP-binding protein [Methylophaga nitratireducenticrescens]
MKVTFSLSHSFTDEQSLIINRVATLIGENGCGKSSILQSIFDEGLKDNHARAFRTICFSSGQNESFSKSFNKYVKKNRRQGRAMSLASFYFDKSWSKPIIFLATALVRDGKTRAFLKDRGYAGESNDINRDDVSTKLSFKFKVDNRYTLRVQDALRREEIGEKGTLRQGPFHRSLESFIEQIVDPNFNFENKLDAVRIELTASDILAVKFAKVDPEAEVNEQDFGDDPSISFLTQAVNAGFVNKWTFQLRFEHGLELDDLSDGEYQLLFLYALIDLFDSENTLFLFDEADSHLHYKNVEKLWSLLHSIKGHVITTTHLLDSISAKENRFEHLKVVEKGRISEDNKIKQLINRLSVLSRAKSVEFEVCGKLPNIALIDDYNDWIIFTLLAARKGLDVTLLTQVHAIGKPSSRNDDNELIGKAKIDWTQSLSKAETEFETTNVFLVCDRDNSYPRWHENGVLLMGKPKVVVNSIRWPGNRSVQTYLLAWRRREIENYLLSFSALTHFGVIDAINSKLAQDFHLRDGDPGDNDGIRMLDVKHIVNPLIEIQGVGKDLTKIEFYINQMMPEEISEDITNMYNFINEKL